MKRDVKSTSNQVAKKIVKPYEPIKLEVIAISEDVILASTFYTEGIYDKFWE